MNKTFKNSDDFAHTYYTPYKIFLEIQINNKHDAQNHMIINLIIYII